MAISYALPHVFTRALAQNVVRLAWEVSGLWPVDKARIVSQLPVKYTGPRPQALLRNTLCPPIGSSVINTTEMIDKSVAWKESRASIIHDDDSGDCDADPVPLDILQQLEEEDTQSGVPVTPPEGNVERVAEVQEEEEEEGEPASLEEEAERNVVDVEYWNDDHAILE
jgi:hypothetical protein